MSRVSNFVMFALIVSVSTAAGDLITFDDLYSIPRSEDPQISPDGGDLAFVLTENDVISGESISHIWLDRGCDGVDLQQLTNGKSGESYPRWSPDGTTVAFISDRGDGDQIFAIPINGGESRQLTRVTTQVSDFIWVPEGNSLVFTSRVFPECSTDTCNERIVEERENADVKAKIYDDLMFRHYSRWFDGKVGRVFIYDIESDSAIQVTFTHDDAPISPIGGHEDIAISPDGAEICYVTNTDPVPAVSTNSDIFIQKLDGGPAARISTSPGGDYGPQYSPDGKSIAFLSQARAGYESDQSEIMLYDRTTAEINKLTGDFDRSPWGLHWSSNSRYIYFMAIDRGYELPYSIDIKSREIEKLLDDAVYGSLELDPKGKFIVVNRSLSDQPYELHKYDLKSGKLTRLTRFTEQITGRLTLNRAEEFWFIGTNGDSVHGFITMPTTPLEDKHPMVLLIHGGPQWIWLTDFNYYGWNTQLMAAQGYVVAQINPHGSSGYGLAFKEYVSGNWGRGDYDDLTMGVDYLIENYPIIDTSRIAALGRSYGGFMTNWICGHTDRFKCLITIDGTYNHVAEYGTTDELWFPEWECNGTPWTNREEYIRSSPLTYVENCVTPTLIIHGAYDYRVDQSEAFQMFTALRRHGTPARLIYYPDEGHQIHGIHNFRHVYNQQFKWLRKWLE
jgi:dipeptidyl aminopeptidase/acylaminoacyl peptidase